MQNKVSHQFITTIGITLGLFTSLNLALFTSPADAACRPTGRFAAGSQVLKCSGSTRCRATGRYKIVRGIRYNILTCPR